MRQILLLLLLFTLGTSCTVMYRAARFGEENIDDNNAFPTYDMGENENKYHFAEKEIQVIDTFDINWKYRDITYHNLDSLLENTTTRSFLIIKDDSIVYEKYFRGYKRNDISTVFSVSKSVTSLLVGIAIDEGYIENVNDPVTKYIPELNKADPMFKKLTIRNLLDMRSGIDFDENYSFNPFSKIARLYYGRNQLALVKKLKFNYEPGTMHEYQSISTTILGIVIEKATRQSFAKYFDDKVWKQLEMENTAKWNLDDKKHQSAKAFGGLSISAIDLAKIGRLYLNNGRYKGKQIVSENWIKETCTPNVANFGYQNQWYSVSAAGADTAGLSYFDDSITAQKLWETKYKTRYSHYKIVKVQKTDYKEKYREKYWKFKEDSKWRLKLYTNQYYALGIMKQIMFIDPEKNTIFVRLGDESDFENYVSLMYKINKIL